MSKNGEWGSVTPAAMPRVVFELKAWKDDAAPILVEHEKRLDVGDQRHEELKDLIETRFARAEGAFWALAGVWAVLAAGVGWYLTGR
jgi:hypothetical protein